MTTQTPDLVAWAAESYRALNLTWKSVPAKMGAARVLGTTHDQAALMDLTVRNSKVIAASAVIPIKSEYVPMVTLLLASLVEGASLQEADAFFARTVRKLRRDRPSETIAPWHKWRVILTTNTLGLLTVQVK